MSNARQSLSRDPTGMRVDRPPRLAKTAPTTTQMSGAHDAFRVPTRFHTVLWMSLPIGVVPNANTRLRTSSPTLPPREKKRPIQCDQRTRLALAARRSHWYAKIARSIAASSGLSTVRRRSSVEPISFQESLLASEAWRRACSGWPSTSVAVLRQAAGAT